MMLKKFWRLTPSGGNEFQLEGRQEIQRNVDFVNRINVGHGLVMANWDEDARLGRAGTFGVVLSIDALRGIIEAEWRPADASFRPSPQGFQFWRKETGWFGFAPKVVERYRLKALFHEAFPDLSELSVTRFIRASKAEAAASAKTVPGFVYLIQSPYGYKIGKSVNVKQRTRLFSIKLPFEIELLHYARFEDYTAAERAFHLRFQNKRLEGEWFDLNESDIAYILSQGEAVDCRGL